MAYTVSTPSGNVNKIDSILYNVTVQFVVNDGSSDIFDRQFTQRYNSETSLSILSAKLLAQFELSWDYFIAEENIEGSTAFTNLLSGLASDATTYTNT